MLTPSSSSSFAFGRGKNAAGAPGEKGERARRSDLEERGDDVGPKDEDHNNVTTALDDNGNNRVQRSTSSSLPRHRAILHSRNLSEALSAMKPVSREDCGGAALPSPPVSPCLPSPSSSPPSVQPLTPPSSPGTRGISVRGNLEYLTTGSVSKQNVTPVMHGSLEPPTGQGLTCSQETKYTGDRVVRVAPFQDQNMY